MRLRLVRLPRCGWKRRIAGSSGEEIELEPCQTGRSQHQRRFGGGARETRGLVSRSPRSLTNPQAKKFVESTPQVLKDNVPKEDAEKLKATLEALGASVSLS